MPAPLHDQPVPERGSLVQVRSRPYLVTRVQPPAPTRPGDDTLVTLSCLSDDAQGEELEVLWERELDARRLPEHGLAPTRFDDPRHFAAYLHALRWGCVSSTDALALQAPYRAGIQIKAYQLAPLRMALDMPRVNLFIADDVGLGKTIEAGLILRELISRQRARLVVVVAPPSVVLQWRDELDARFGLPFVVVDRDYLTQVRRERGYGVNPWATHDRFIISHALLRRSEYADGLERRLRSDEEGNDTRGPHPSSLLILDEAHHAAPASGSQGSAFAQALARLARYFEHRLFLSATPHNGHSTSFTALLALLDPSRFVRGLPVDPSRRDEIMIRRLKRDLLRLPSAESGFPERRIEAISIADLPEHAPELVLASLLERYRSAREARLVAQSSAQRGIAKVITISLQKRLLSSIAAFRHTLEIHHAAVSRVALGQAGDASTSSDPLDDATDLVDEPGPDDDDERSEDERLDAHTRAVRDRSHAGGPASPAELALLAEMAELAERHVDEPDAKLERLLAWIRANLCPEGRWNGRRVIIFTEYTDTRRWLVRQLVRGLTDTDDDVQRRVDSLHGAMGRERMRDGERQVDPREEIKRVFNEPPDRHPLRILVCTDAAREGVNLQNYCADLFHFDIPWNPSRMEQRNGRIDRKLQREPVVHCRYFVHAQRPADIVLDALVSKTETIRREVGSLSPVLERRFDALLAEGIPHARCDELAQQLVALDPLDDEQRRIDAELEATQADDARVELLRNSLEDLRGLLARSRQRLDFDPQQLRRALSASLELAGADPLARLDDDDEGRWGMPNLDTQIHADPSWHATLDTLREPRRSDELLWAWRKRAAIRPLVFEAPGAIEPDLVHVHLEHRLTRRLLARFLAQGFARDELARACVLRSDDPLHWAIAWSRLALLGSDASRLHEELIPIVARVREGRELELVSDDAERRRVLGLVDRSLASARLSRVDEGLEGELAPRAAGHAEQLGQHLRELAEQRAKQAIAQLRARGQLEAKKLADLLTTQREALAAEIRVETTQGQVSEGAQRPLFHDDEPTIDSPRRGLLAEWQARLHELEGQLESEPKRVRSSFAAKTTRIELVGMIYLWPSSD